MEKTRVDQGWAGHLRDTLVLGAPLAATNLAQTAMTATDVAMLGLLGPDALAAGALGANLYLALLIFGIGLTSATAPMVAQEVGRNRHAVREVRRTVRQGFWAAAALAVPANAVLWEAEPILRAMGQDASLAALAGAYTRTLEWGMLPFLVALVLRCALTALGRPNAALAVVFLAIPLNAGLNWVLIFGRYGAPALGVAGSGVASALSNLFIVAGLAVLVARDRRLRRYRLFGRWWRADWPRFAAFARVGLPIGATAAFEVTVFNAAVFLMGLIGADSLAAHAVVIQIATLSFMIPLGLAQATTVRVGLAAGGGDRVGVSRAGWAGLILGEAAMLVSATLMLFAPGPLIAVFLDRTDPRNAVTDGLAQLFLAVAAAFQVADGAQVIAAGMLRGLNDTRVPMFFALAGYWVIGLPLGVGLAFGAGLAGVGLWVGLASGLFIVAGLMLWRWTRRDALGLTVPA